MAAKFDKRKSSECFNEAVVRHIQRLIKAKNFWACYSSN